MKLKQEKLEFKPITLTLETEEEAKAFIDLIEDIELTDYGINTPKRNLIIAISDAFTDCLADIPNYNNIEV